MTRYVTRYARYNYATVNKSTNLPKLMTITAPTLPGTPASYGEQNAQAKVDSLVGINQILIATDRPIFEAESLGEEAQDILSDLLWNE